MHKKKQDFSSYLLDKCSIKDIRLWKQRHDAILKYYWDHYSYFAHQRSLIFEELKNSLVINCKPFKFESWQRILNYKFCLDPLSARGSILNSSGGRFNIGDIDPIKYPKFAALYVAEDRETAYREKYGLNKNNNLGLSSEELTLTSKESSLIVSVFGEIEKVLSVDSASLKDFFNLIKKIKVSRSLIKQAKRLNTPVLREVKTIEELLHTLLDPNWRERPMVIDIPSNSQILGQICQAAGVGAILYPSRVVAGKRCLSIFPQNFINSISYVEIQGDFPEQIQHRRLDGIVCTELV